MLNGRLAGFWHTEFCFFSLYSFFILAEFCQFLLSVFLSSVRLLCFPLTAFASHLLMARSSPPLFPLSDFFPSVLLSPTTWKTHLSNTGRSSHRLSSSSVAKYEALWCKQVFSVASSSWGLAPRRSDFFLRWWTQQLFSVSVHVTEQLRCLVGPSFRPFFFFHRRVNYWKQQG